MKRYVEWATKSKEPLHIKAVSRKVAGKYLGYLMGQNTDPVTGNKPLSGLAAYWNWLEGFIVADVPRA